MGQVILRSFIYLRSYKTEGNVCVPFICSMKNYRLRYEQLSPEIQDYMHGF